VGNGSCKKWHIVTGTVTLTVIFTARQAREKKGVRQEYDLIHTQRMLVALKWFTYYLVLYSYVIFNNTLFNYDTCKRIRNSLDDWEMNIILTPFN